MVGDSAPTGWTHIVLNYIGPNDESDEAVTMFFNGTEEDSDTTKDGLPYSPGDGRIVLGRLYTDSDNGYSSVQVDELTFFNRTLTLDEIAALANAT